MWVKVTLNESGKRVAVNLDHIESIEPAPHGQPGALLHPASGGSFAVRQSFVGLLRVVAAQDLPLDAAPEDEAAGQFA